MLTIVGTRFGDVSVDQEAIIEFPRGLIGFPQDDSFVLLERDSSEGDRSELGYLQSTKTAKLCFPVIDGSAIGPDYPKPEATKLAQSAGLGFEDLAVLVVVAVPQRGKPLRANLLAPLVVDVRQRRGAQVVLDHRMFKPRAAIAKKESSSLPPNLVPPTKVQSRGATAP